MESATITLKLTPRNFDLVRAAVRDYLETHQEMIEDPVVKEEDKRQAGAEVMYASALLKSWGEEVKN